MHLTETGTTASRSIRHWSWLLAIAGATFAAVSIATRYGIGVSTDSVAYIAEARQLVNGEGLTLPAGLLEIYADVDPSRSVVPTAHFPPMYPLVIALTGLAHDSASSFRWLNSLLLSITATTLAAMVERDTRSRWAACLAVGVVVLAPAVLRVHSMAWSEPLFVALGFAGLLALARFLEVQDTWMLVTGSAGVGLAWLTRYVGIAFVLTGLVALLLHRRRIGRRPAAVYLLVSALPMTAYLGAMALSDGGGAGFTLVAERPAPGELRLGVESLRDWFRVARPLSIVHLAAWASVAILLYLQLRRGTRPRSGEPDDRLRHLPVVLVSFLVIYPAVLLVSLSVFAEYLPLEERYLVPLYVAAVALAACAVSRLLRARRRFREPLLVAVALVVAGTAAVGTTVLDTGTHGYPGFEAHFWRESEAMTEIEGLPQSTRIYSNYPEAIYFRTGREARLLPRKRLPGDRTPRYRTARMSRLVDDVREGDGVVVFFTTAHRDLLPTPDELSSVLGLPPSRELSDALVYRAGRPR